MERFKQKLLQAGIPFRENEPLAAHCTFKIGGPAQLFVQPQTEQQLCSAAALCKEQAVRYYLLGNGSKPHCKAAVPSAAARTAVQGRRS